MLPQHKHDIERAKKLVDIGYPVLEPYLDELFQWLQDGTWGVARPVAAFLSTIGLPVAPYARKILQGNDDIWKMNVLASVVNVDDLIVANALRDEIERIAKNPTQGEMLEDAQEIAEEILKKIN